MRHIVFRHHPCLTCGACCAAFRVSFYWREADDTPGGTVPLALTEDVSDLRRCMRGTNRAQPRCVALAGTIGQQVRCTIYAQRSLTCREFGLRRAGGRWIATLDQLAQCNRARLRHGLAPLALPDSRRRLKPPLHPRRRRFPRSA